MIIGISGKQRSGKDTAAYILKNLLLNAGYQFTIKSLAMPLKQAYAKAACMTLDELEKVKEHHRPALQKMGEEGRAIKPDYWIEKLVKGVAPGENIIIADVRYKDEYAYIRSKGGIVIRMEAKQGTREARGRLQGEDHISETDLDVLPNQGWDAVIHNDYEAQFLSAKLQEFVHKLKPRLCEFLL